MVADCVAALVGFDQPVGFIHHAMATAASDGAPCEMVDRINSAAVWADNRAAITTGSGVSVDGLRHHSAPLAAIAAFTLRLPIPWARKAMITRRPRLWHNLQSAHVLVSLR